MSRPKFLEGIADKELHDWAKHLHSLWKSLCRKVMFFAVSLGHVIHYFLIMLSKLLIQITDLGLLYLCHICCALTIENDFSWRSVLMLKITQSSTHWYTPHIPPSYLECASGSSTIGEWIMRPISWLPGLKHSKVRARTFPSQGFSAKSSPRCHVQTVTRAVSCPTGTPTGSSTGSCCQRWQRLPMGWFKISSTLSTGEPQITSLHSYH